MGATGKRICVVCHHTIEPLPSELECFDVTRFEDANGESSYCPRCLIYRRPQVKYRGTERYVQWYGCSRCMDALKNYEEYADLVK